MRNLTKVMALVVVMCAACGEDGDDVVLDEDGFLAQFDDGRFHNGTCAPVGTNYEEVYDCSVTQGPGGGSSGPASVKVADADVDPLRLDDPDVEWAQQQIESCSCQCCHNDRGGVSGSYWAVDFQPFWIDSFNDSGLQKMAGLWEADDHSKSQYLNPAKNNGFSRELGPPTTDPERMQSFFMRMIDFRE